MLWWKYEGVGSSGPPPPQDKLQYKLGLDVKRGELVGFLDV